MIKKYVLLGLLIYGIGSTACAQEDTLQQSMKRGESLYASNCSSCHMPTGEGLGGAFPPLANSNWLKNQKQVIGIVLKGLEGEVTVNDDVYNAPMASFSHLTDRDIADILNFVSNNWGNKQPMIKPAQVKAERK